MANRDLTPLMRMFRNLINRRELKNHLRFEGKVSNRTQPPPNMPHGTSGKIAFNYFYTRDGRREAFPPQEPYQAGNKALASGEEQASDSTAVTSKVKTPKPGLGNGLGAL